MGKTSLIRTLMNDKFVTEVPPRSPDVAVPPEMTLKEVTTYIIDSSFRVQDEAEIACVAFGFDIAIPTNHFIRSALSPPARARARSP